MKKVSNVFYVTTALVILFVLIGAIIPVRFEQITTNINAFLSTTFGWYYMWLMVALVVLSLFIIISPYGKIRLGKNNDRPDFSTPTWIAMLFSAGLELDLCFTERQSRFFTDF